MIKSLSSTTKPQVVKQISLSYLLIWSIATGIKVDTNKQKIKQIPMRYAAVTVEYDASFVPVIGT